MKKKNEIKKNLKTDKKVFKSSPLHYTDVHIFFVYLRTQYEANKPK